jgi:Fe-S-cluster-containing hydrogenase component 2
MAKRDIKMYLAVEESKCTGCRVCELTCSVEHYKVYNPKRSRIQVRRDNTPGSYNIFVCNSCDGYPCKEACPKDAIELIKTGNGNMKAFIDKDACTNCGLCAKVCPYNAVIRDPLKNFLVCDMCGGDFKCVEECPTGALFLKEIS